ncbi:MAG: hypothetical protein HC860_02595 [Alkalinema sp. RU_4_3]|nr:hypothetical protein [Alkalinema sp. RU_4_3]
MTSHSKQPAQFMEAPHSTDLYNAIVQQRDVTLLKNGNDISVEIAPSPHGKISYPWNPSESADFFNAMDQAPQLTDLMDDGEIETRAHSFFNTLDQLWDRSLQTMLVRKFATVPQAILATIASQAERLAQSAASQADQLIQCAQQALPQWDIDDLSVMARPMAYALRGGEAKAETIAKDWTVLSEVDRAKLVLEIAQYALNQTQQGSEG